jgi:hypothetical protein
MDDHKEDRDPEITHNRADDAATPISPNEDPRIHPNPPRTTAGGITAPKFGSAGSGGAEIEPGPERD